MYLLVNAKFQLELSNRIFHNSPKYRILTEFHKTADQRCSCTWWRHRRSFPSTNDRLPKNWKRRWHICRKKAAHMVKHRQRCIYVTVRRGDPDSRNSPSAGWETDGPPSSEEKEDLTNQIRSRNTRKEDTEDGI